MTIKEIVSRLGLQWVTATDKEHIEVADGYVSDLLSDVMANAKSGDLWVTLQTHENIVAVAVLKELSGVIIVNGRRPPQETISRAEQQGVPIFVSEHRGFDVVGRLYSLLNAEEV